MVCRGNAFSYSGVPVAMRKRNFSSWLGRAVKKTVRIFPRTFMPWKNPFAVYGRSRKSWGTSMFPLVFSVGRFFRSVRYPSRIVRCVFRIRFCAKGCLPWGNPSWALFAVKGEYGRPASDNVSPEQTFFWMFFGAFRVLGKFFPGDGNGGPMRFPMGNLYMDDYNVLYNMGFFPVFLFDFLRKFW